MDGVMGIMLLVDILGLGIVIFIVWWFWFYKSRAAIQKSDAAPVEITVADNVYHPARLALPSGQPIVLRFIRRDPASCAAQVQFASLAISAELPLDQPVDIRLPSLAPGEYSFNCQMNMYHGTLVIT